MFKWDLIWSSRTALIRGFWWNVKLFVVAEVIVLVWALVVAVVRQLPGRAFLPLRTLAIVYADVFRGIPTIIVIYLIGFGFPLAGIEPFATHMSGNTQLFWLGVLSLVARVRRIRRGGLPVGAREHPLEPDRGRALARAVAMADAAPRRGPASGAPDPPAAPQRLRRPAEGHGARLDHRTVGDPARRRAS